MRLFALESSIDLSGNFYGKRGNPRGHFSESHLDSLGLCLFLAIRRLHQKQSPDLSILILDDILQSVDGDHRTRTADLIFSEFKDHQIIITTHDQLWFENLKESAKRHASGLKLKQLRISDWTIDHGPSWGDHLSDYEWLTSAAGIAAKPADRVAKAGRMLEHVLQNLCNNLGVAVQFNILGKYTIDPLWNGFYKKAKEYKGFFETAGAKIHLDTIDQLRSMRNLVGAHWNEWAAKLTDSESKQLTDAIIGLRKLVYCDTCQRFIIRIPELVDTWSCRKEHLKYKKAIT